MASQGYVQTSLIWVAYAVAVGLALIAASITTFIWQTPRERSALVTAVAIVALTSLLATVFLLPVDIALVSSTTSTHLGAKKDWATSARVDSILLTLKIVYYTLYSFDALLCLIVIPFSYFWFEEYDEVEEQEGNQTFGSRLWGAFKYTIAFVLLVVIIFLVGFFVPAAGARGDGKHLDLDFFKRLLDENHGEKALTFGVGLLTTLGTLLYIVYSGAGLALFPISFIKSAPSVSAPQLSENTASQLEQNRERQRQIEMRNAGRSEGMPTKDRRELDDLAREERTLIRRERLAAEAQGEGKGFIVRAWGKVCALFRPIKLIGGIIIIVLSLIVWVSMLITGIDKAVNSVCKEHCGYILAHINVFQPINWLFVQTARAFPVDYVLMALLILLFFSASVSGLAAIGIRFLWLRIFQIRKGRTTPQALLVATVMLSLITLGINYAIAMMVAPQYASYGTQTFCDLPPRHPLGRPDCSDQPDAVKPCSEWVSSSSRWPRETQDVCTPTVMSTFLNRITLNWPFFGDVSFWAQFAFLGIFLIVFLTSLFRAPKLNMGDIDEEAEADEEEGLLATTGRRFGATWQDIRGRVKNGNNGAGADRNGPGSPA
ncbi:hypothetical protein GGS26DRAFT_558911 [Hypomontagnella submonticulosa]|nr:hypothetical protein GGS26DRAFT_558911 [Hypomontagnella submonticulosa]